MDQFPVPFRGIDSYIDSLDAPRLAIAVNALLTCGHQHNFAVQMDGRRLHLSYGAATCVERALGRRT